MAEVPVHLRSTAVVPLSRVPTPPLSWKLILLAAAPNAMTPPEGARCLSQQRAYVPTQARLVCPQRTVVWFTVKGGGRKPGSAQAAGKGWTVQSSRANRKDVRTAKSVREMKRGLEEVLLLVEMKRFSALCSSLRVPLACKREPAVLSSAPSFWPCRVGRTYVDGF